MSKNIYGRESEVGEYAFSIEPPWYRAWWAYTSYILLLASFVWFIVWLNSRRLIAQKKMLQKEVERKTHHLMLANKEITEQKKVVEEAQKNTMDNIEYARRIQQALLTGEKYISEYLSDYFILYLPKDIISGDFYWGLEKGGSFYLATVDCTGHGVPGTLMSVLGISFLNEIVIERNIASPEEILNQLRAEIIQRLNPDGKEDIKDGMDMALCRYDLKSGTMEFAGANRGVMLVRRGEALEYKGDEMPVSAAMDATVPFCLKRLNLEKGDMVYTYTDGYADQFGGAKNKKFSRNKTKELLLLLSSKPAAEQKEIILKTLNEWKGSGEQTDDVTVIGIRV